MIFLEPGNLIIEEIVTCKMQEGAKKEPVDVRLSDFDGASCAIYSCPQLPPC
jgi:hypothetical protein